MSAVSLLFRYADFVTCLGGSEMQLGLIVGTGMVGSLAMRAVQGVAIDRYGPQRVWLLSLVLLIGSLWGHLAVERLDGWAVYLLRVLYMSSLAGAFGASITHVSLRAPAGRMAETIGVLGSSGFIGMALGPVLGDWLLSVPRVARGDVDRMFIWSGAMGCLSLATALAATWGGPRPRLRRRPPLLLVLRRYHPGSLLLVAIAMGAGIGLPHTFLRTYAADLEITRIKAFFIGYAAVAFSVRIVLRKVPDRWGNRPVTLCGLVLLALSMVMYLAVRGGWSLLIPAAVGGVAHALLFPSVVAGGTASFPARYRGLGTTLVLSMFDIGNLLGQPAIGALVHFAGQAGWPAYPTMFLAVATVLLGVAGFFAVASRERPEPHAARAGQVVATGATVDDSAVITVPEGTALEGLVGPGR